MNRVGISHVKMKRVAWACAVCLAVFCLCLAVSLPPPVLDASYMAVGTSFADQSSFPGVFTGHPGDIFYLTRYMNVSRSGNVRFRHYFVSQFGAVRIPDTEWHFNKGWNIHRNAVKIPPDLPPQLWAYVTIEDDGWFGRESAPLPLIRVCVLEAGQTRTDEQVCPSRSSEINP